MRRYVNYNIMYRLLSRATEVAEEPGISNEVKRVHDDLLAPHAIAFCKSHDAVAKAEGAAAKARRKVREELTVFDGYYRAARSVVLAFNPEEKLPDTLKAQTTDTDMLTAVMALSSVVQSHAGEPWADGLLAGLFGTRAPKVIEALKDLIAANKALSAANRRLQVRPSAAKQIEDVEEAAPESGVNPSTSDIAAAAGTPAVVKIA
jgi:hypothetical protein